MKTRKYEEKHIWKSLNVKNVLNTSTKLYFFYSEKEIKLSGAKILQEFTQ